MPRWHERVVHRACGGGYEWGGSWSDDEPLDAVELDLTIEEGFFADHRQPPGSRIVHNGTGFAGGGKKDAEHVLFDPRLVINLEHYELSHAADPKTRDKRLAIEWLERHFDVSLEEYR